MEKKSESKEEQKEHRYLRREFSYSKFQQTMILPRAFEERWQKPGDKVRFAAFSETYDGMNVGYVTRPTSRFVEDYNYLELATLNVAYEFGVARLKRLGIKRLKAMFYMNDVFHASSVKQERGIDYPFARNFSIGLQVRF